MSRAEIHAGICGFRTTIIATMRGRLCEISIESDCDAVQSLASELIRVNPMQEISFRGREPEVLRLAAAHCTHSACPVPVGILKAVEVEAGLALPANVSITLSKV